MDKVFPLTYKNFWRKESEKYPISCSTKILGISLLCIFFLFWIFLFWIQLTTRFSILSCIFITREMPSRYEFPQATYHRICYVNLYYYLISSPSVSPSFSCLLPVPPESPAFLLLWHKKRKTNPPFSSPSDPLLPCTSASPPPRWCRPPLPQTDSVVFSPQTMPAPSTADDDDALHRGPLSSPSPAAAAALALALHHGRRRPSQRPPSCLPGLWNTRCVASLTRRTGVAEHQMWAGTASPATASRCSQAFSSLLAPIVSMGTKQQSCNLQFPPCS